MDGTLNNNGLLEVIATLTSRGESGRLQITAGGSRGAFFFKKGKLVDAHMGPFSGFPAVNFAVSLGEATLKFDSSIRPPASSSIFIATNEQVLLKERFGIETIDPDSVEEQTTQTPAAKLPEAITAQYPLSEAPLSSGAIASHEFAYKEPADFNIRSKPRARESRRRTARNRRASREKNETLRIADQFRNQAAEAARTRVEMEKGFEMAERPVEERKPSQITSPPITLGSTTSETARNPRIKSLAEKEKPSQTSGPAITREFPTIDLREDAGTKRCPKCNRVYSDFRTYCRHDSTQLVSQSNTSLNVAPKPEVATSPALIWTLVVITLLVSGVFGYWLSSYISREPSAATPIRAESEQPSNAEQDQPVVEGPLDGKESTLMKPEYPARAKSDGVSGKVTVAVLVNKQGLVVSARVLKGPPLLRAAALVAARKTKFFPEKLAGKRSKISGTITYSFKL